MVGCAGTGRVRARAGRPRSFEEGWSNANKRIYISNKTFGEWRMLRSHLGLSNDDEVANFLLNRYQQESRGDDLDPVLRLEYKMYEYKLRSQV